MTGPESTTIRIDARALLPVIALGLVVFLIIFVELCGKTDVKPITGSGTPIPIGPTATLGPTSTAGPSATPDPGQATATQENAAAGADRDEIRQADLVKIRTGLDLYFEQNGEYPSTEGGIQTVCTFEDDDEGCAIKETIEGGTVPQDPLGNPGTNGYWLESTETTYTIFAQRESELFPGCPEKPAHLKEFPSVFCIRSQ
jgi:hypothetical protein